MPDITMCQSEVCIVRETCYRYTAKPNKYRQSYFFRAPGKDEKCKYYAPRRVSKVV